MEAYHTTSSGTGRNRSTRRVVTRRASYDFKYTEFVDNSEPISSLYFLKAMPLLRLDQKKEIKMGPEIAARYESEKAIFFNENNTDTSYTWTEYKYINGYTDKCIVHTSDKGGDDLPWFISSRALLYGDMNHIGWIQRWMLAVSTFVVEYRFRKTILR